MNRRVVSHVIRLILTAVISASALGTITAAATSSATATASPAVVSYEGANTPWG